MKFELDLAIRKAEKKAREVIDSYGISTPEDIRVEDIAYDNGVQIIEGNLEGAAASIVVSGNKGVITLPSLDLKERVLFSCCHELGHFFLDHLHSMQKVCSNEDIITWHNNDIETQANFFSAEFMMPEKMFKPLCNIGEANFNVIREIGKLFKSSLTAAAIRFVRFSPEPCAVILSRDQKIKWFYPSEEWEKMSPFIKIGSTLDHRTLAYDFFVGKEVAEEPEEVEADAWVSLRGIDEVVEHSISSDKYMSVLTILHIKS